MYCIEIWGKLSNIWVPTKWTFRWHETKINFSNFQLFLSRVMHMATRDTGSLWLIDEAPIEEITRALLPSKDQVVLHYFHHRHGMGETSSASRKALMKVALFWSCAGIPTTGVAQAGAKMSKLVKAFNDLKELWMYSMNTETSCGWDFQGRPPRNLRPRTLLFSPVQWADVKAKEKVFLRSQRGIIEGWNWPHESKKVKLVKRRTLLNWLQEREDTNSAKLTGKAEILSQNSSSPVSTTSSPSRKFQSLKKLSPRIFVKEFDLISTRDRKKLSVRAASNVNVRSYLSSSWNRHREYGGLERPAHRARIAGRKQAVKKSWNCGTRRYSRGWSCNENCFRLSLAIRRTASPSHSQRKITQSSFLTDTNVGCSGLAPSV